MEKIHVVNRQINSSAILRRTQGLHLVPPPPVVLNKDCLRIVSQIFK